MPKCLLPIGRSSVLERIVRYWKRWAREFVLVVPPDSREIEMEAERLKIRYRLVVQEGPDGIGSAVALAEGKTSREFIVVLGDCLLKGRFETSRFPQRGIAVWKGGDACSIRSNYGVVLRGGTIARVREKPRSTEGYLCGMGVYFFDETIFDIIRKMKRSMGGGVGITPVLSTALKNGYGLEAVFFRGGYVNVNTPPDLGKAVTLFRH